MSLNNGFLKVMKYMVIVCLINQINAQENISSLNTDFFPELAVSSDATLRKCNCQANEVYVNDTCSNFPTFVGLYDIVNSNLVKVDTTEYQNIEVNELQCKSPSLKANITADEFAITPNGKLYLHSLGLSFDVENYCIDHLLRNDGGLYWRAEICVLPPPIPRCCLLKSHEENQTYIENCGQENVTFSPPIVEGSDILTWDRLETKDLTLPNCNIGDSVISIHLDNYETSSLLYSPEGPYLFYQPSNLHPLFHISPDEYCLSAVESENYVSYQASFCYPDELIVEKVDCNNSTCVRKCCPLGESYNDSKICTASEGSFDLSKSFYDAKRQIHTKPPDDIKILVGSPDCYLLDVPSTDNKRKQPLLLTSGQLYIQQTETFLSVSEYCLDFKQDSKNNHIFYCAKDQEDVSSFKKLWKQTIMPVFLGISCVFMLATLIIFISVTELRIKLSSQCLVSQVSALLAAYIAYIIILVIKDDVSDPACQTLGE